MISWKISLCAILVTATWHQAHSASLPLPPARLGHYEVLEEAPVPVPRLPAEIKVREGAPPPLCAGRCFAPPAGPVCALNAAGTARTFATLCELEAVSCRESTYYAITSLGEC
ncbi:hypothetical protein ACJJTC_019732 [Scirpophaga incertulas]